MPHTKPKLITVKEAAEILGLEEKTVHNRGAGTHVLTRVRFGRSIRFIQQEVEEFRDKRIRAAEKLKRH